MVALSKGFMGVTRAQTELVQHWQSCSQNGVLPPRTCLDPGAIKAHLSEISMIEVSETGRAKFRLAGSGLRALFGQEMRGRLLSELDRTTYEMWSLGLARAFDMQQPIGGLIERETDTHAWLRLPLRSERSSALVLCHDALIPNARLRDQSYRKVSLGSHLAA
jgi:hypothetical protein